MLHLSRITRLALVAVAVLIGVAGCQTESRTTRTSKQHIEITLPGSDTPVCVIDFASDGHSTATAPGATSQPTVTMIDDSSASASASGQQLPPVLPAFAYDAKTRAYIFYGGAFLFLVAAVFFAYKGKRQLAAFCIGGFFLMLGAQVFIDKWAWSIFPIILVIGCVWGGAWYFTNQASRKKENRLTNKTALKAANSGADASTVAAILSTSPSGRDAADELARESSPSLAV